MASSTVLAIRQLELLPSTEAASLLTARDEDQWFERVSSRIDARALGDLLVGFSNAEGGLIAVGFHEGKVEDLRPLAHLQNDWRQAARDFTVPPVRHTFRMLELALPDGGSAEVAMIEIEPSEGVHETVKGETYLRVGDENRRLGAAEAQELRFDKGQSVHDGLVVPDADMGDLDPALVRAYVRRVPGAEREEAALEARGLVRRKATGRPRPTVAGLLILGREPQRFFPHASVRLLRYAGLARETGPRSNVLSDVRFDGTIVDQIENARKQMRRWLPTTIRLGRAARFAPQSRVPEFAWLEAIVNGVVHRSYSMAGDHIRVELFHDRLEVESPGRLPGLVRLDNIRSTRFARNPRIARAVADLGYGRELGEGVNRMFEEMEQAGLPLPLYTQPAASVKVTFLVEGTFAEILRQLPPGSDRLAEWMARVGSVTTTQAVELLGQSRPTVLGLLHRLEARGLLEHVGSSPKDPRGFWRLKAQVPRNGGR